MLSIVSDKTRAEPNYFAVLEIYLYLHSKNNKVVNITTNVCHMMNYHIVTVTTKISEHNSLEIVSIMADISSEIHFVIS